MKTLLTAALAALLAAPALAAEPKTADSGDKKPAAEEKDREDRSARRIAKLKKKLGLTDEQAAKLQTIHKGHSEAVRPLREQAKKDLEALRAKVEAKASDEDLKAALASVKASRKAMRAESEKLMEKIE